MSGNNPQTLPPILLGYPYSCVSLGDGSVMVRISRAPDLTFENRVDLAAAVERVLNDAGRKAINKLDLRSLEK